MTTLREHFLRPFAEPPGDEWRVRINHDSGEAMLPASQVGPIMLELKQRIIVLEDALEAARRALAVR